MRHNQKIYVSYRTNLQKRRSIRTYNFFNPRRRLDPFDYCLLFDVSDIRHSKSFAAERLQELGFEQVSVLEKYTIGHGIGMPTLPTENWFDFTAVKDGQEVQGRLVCYRQLEDIKESRCELQKLE